MLELKAQFDAAWARQTVALAILNAAPDGATQEPWEAWEPHYHEATDLALEIMRQPCGNPADFAIKVATCEAALKEVIEGEGDDLDEYVGWMDRVLPRLLTDARGLLGCPASA
jgi:hypothetical protein